MVKNKLKRLKRAEENKILSEHEGLYNRLVMENYPQEVKEPKVSRSPFHFNKYAMASFATACAVFVMGVGAFLGFKDLSKSDENFANNTVSEVTVQAIEQSLDYSSLNISDDKIKKVSAHKSGNVNNYFEVEVETFHTFDIIVKVNPECEIPESIKPSINTEREINAHGFTVDYTVSRTRLEDYFTFNTKAVITTESEVYYIRYNYSSVSPECELLDMIEECIKPKDRG